MGKNSAHSANRKKINARYGHLYLPFKPAGHWRDAACAYCGNIAEQRDHIPPLVWMAALGMNYFVSKGLMVCWIPSCAECNRELSDRKLFSIRERTLYLIGRYCKKYAKQLKGTLWEDWQLEEFEGRLRQHIEVQATVERAIDRRLAILEENVRLR